MAVRPPQARGRPVKDVDDANIEKIKARKAKDLNKAEAQEVKQDRDQKPVARKPGQITDTPGVDEEPGFEADGRDAHVEGATESERQKRPDRQGTRKAKEARKKRQQDGQSQPDDDQQEDRPKTLTVAALAAEKRVDLARQRGFQQTPSVQEVVVGKQQVPVGPSFAQMLPESRSRGADLEEPEEELRPPPFLSAFESMKDIYIKVKGRASPRTKDLLEGPDLEDLLQMVAELNENDELRRSAEARVKRSIYVHLADDPGPLLTGLNDPRLLEPWRLLVDGWDIWVPAVESDAEDAEETGVELFWEGEGEDDDGNDLEIVQTLTFKDGHAALKTAFGEDVDDLTFDGQTFYRLKKR